MKTIYNVKALCVVALLGSAAAASAQEDVTKEKNLNREMTLEREYDPSVQDASKVNTLPVVKEPEVRKIPIDYSNYTIAADPQKEISLLPSGNIMTQMDYNKRRGYFNFGAGTYLNINGDLGYHILSTEKDKLNIWYSHRSTNGKVKYIQMDDEKVKAKLNDNLGGINFKHVFDKTIFSIGAKYGYSAFNYYGLPIADAWSMMAEGSLDRVDRETNQVNQTIAANIGFESKEDAPFGYLLDLGYINFSHKYGLNKNIDGPTEHTLEAKFDLNAGFNGNMRIGLGGLVEYFNYNFPEAASNSYVYEFKNHAEVMLSPYYKVEGDNWKIKLGANVMLATGDDAEFMASPNIAADVEVADKTELYVKADGKLYSNSMYDMSQINRYLYPMKELAPSRNWLNAILGIRSGVAPGFWFDIVCFTGHKGLMGPQGTGGLAVAEGIDVAPWAMGGTGVHSFDPLQPLEWPTRLEAGTLNGHGIAGLSAGLDFIEAQGGVEAIAAHERSLAERFLAGVREIPGITLYGAFDQPVRSAIVSLNVGDIDSAEISDALMQGWGIATRPGAHCAPLMHRAMGTERQPRSRRRGRSA